MRKIKLLIFLASFTCLNLEVPLARATLFETVNDDDARLISALLAPRVEQCVPAKAFLTLLPTPPEDEAVLVATALVQRLRDHGLQAELTRNDNAQNLVFVSVRMLPHRMWVRVTVPEQSLFFYLHRGPDGFFKISKEGRGEAKLK
jgi:hypothetical protein